MSFFAVSPFLKALGWALLNSIWQFGVIWLLYYILTVILRKLTAAARHTLAIYLLGTGAVWFIISLSWRYYSYPAAGITDDGFAIQNTTYYNAYHVIERSMDGLMPYWSALYLLCIVVLFVKFCLFIRHAGNLQTKGISKMPVDWRMYVKNIAAQLGIEKSVDVVLSALIDTPQVIGFLKPVILVPIACLNHLTTEQLEAVLLHELVHIKRNDYLTNIFLATAEILFFFNPFVKQFVASIRKEREYSCDDMVLQFRFQPQNYASALLALEKNRSAPLMFGIAVSGQNQRQLLARVKRIIGMKNNQHNITQVSAYMLSVLLLGFVAMVNPAKVAVDKVVPALITFTGNSDAPTPAGNETGIVLTNYKIQQTPAPKKAIHKINITLKEDEHINEAERDDTNDDALAATIYNVNTLNLQTAAATESMDFSLPESSPSAAAMPGATDAIVVTPYVPTSSYSYQLVQDSSHPRIKRETYEERMARESLIKAQQAMKTINWQKIQQQLKYSKRDLDKLKVVLAKQLAELDWEKVNKDAQEQVKGEHLQLLQKTLIQEKAIKEFQEKEVMYEDLQKQIIERDQFLKETDKRAKDQQKVLEEQLQRGQHEMKKRRIIYI